MFIPEKGAILLPCVVVCTVRVIVKAESPELFFFFSIEIDYLTVMKPKRLTDAYKNFKKTIHASPFVKSQ